MSVYQSRKAEYPKGAILILISMAKLCYNDFVKRDLEEMVILTGIPRSGTSIFGQAIGSFSSVEYAYEPPLINYFDAKCRHDELDAEDTTEIALPYLYFDHFTEYLHGRRYSFREEDFSYILDMKPLPEILNQWRKVRGLQDAVNIANEHMFVLKYPGCYDFLDALYEEIPNIRIIDIGRGLNRILASQYAKDWYIDQNFERDSAGKWPYYDNDGLLVPYLVYEEDIERWQSWNPETRTVYLVNRYAEARLSFMDKYRERDSYMGVRYEQLIQNPRSFIEDVAEFLGADWGVKTEEIVSDVRSTSPPADIDEIFKDCQGGVKNRFEELRPKLEYK